MPIAHHVCASACFLMLWMLVVIEKMHCFVPLKNATLCCSAVQVILVLILTLYGFFERSVKQLDFYGSNKTPKPNLLCITQEKQYNTYIFRQHLLFFVTFVFLPKCFSYFMIFQSSAVNTNLKNQHIWKNLGIYSICCISQCMTETISVLVIGRYFQYLPIYRFGRY